MMTQLSNKIRHFFHVVSNVRPIYWICLYIILTPIFALIYWWLPDTQFRIPDGAGTDYGSWLYYSIVTITTLGFGDYTPAHGWAQGITAIEVMCGLIILGFFLNAVGSMKSEIDVESEIEKQKRLHEAGETDKLVKSAPAILHNLNLFMAYCYAVTTPFSTRSKSDGADFNTNFSFNDMADLYRPSCLPADHTSRPAVEGLLKCASRVSLYIDSLQNRIDLAIWPDLLDDCFAFVANYQMFTSADALADKTYLIPRGKATTIEEAEAALSDRISKWTGPVEAGETDKVEPIVELYTFIKENAPLARKIESVLTKIASTGVSS